MSIPFPSMIGFDIIVKSLNILTSAIEKEIRLVAGVEQEVKKLISNLQSIHAELIDAEGKLLKDPSFRLWLDSLKSVAYDIDDVLDEWSYENLKSQIVTSKVWSFDPQPSCFCLLRVALRHHIAVKLSDLNARLDVIAAQKGKYVSLLVQGIHEHVERPLTSYVIDISAVKGREVEKERLVNMLLAESSEWPKLHLISIVGMGGIGKTTLAQLVYNDEMVDTHFDVRIWVCVPEPYDRIRIFETILESLIRHTPNLVESQSIQVKIQKSVEGKKFLLVLDGVWNEDPNEWKLLEDCLISGSFGSKILVTARNENVAKLMGCMDKDIFRVGLLSKEECWSMFCEIAFYCHTSEQRRNLETIGVEIVARCKGLPLAVKTMAGLLRFQFSKGEWECLLGSELWKLEKAKRDILGQLWLSYYDLPSPLRQCFLYCANFPKGYRISKDELISLWMAHGFLKPTEDRDMEMVGNDYFHDLGMRSLFQEFEVEEKFNSLDKTYCKMHDLVHDLARYMIGKECLYIDINSIEETTGHWFSGHTSIPKLSKKVGVLDSSLRFLKKLNIPYYSNNNSAEEGINSVHTEDIDNLYHLIVKLGEKVEFLDSFYNLRKLRSLVILPPKYDSLVGSALPKIFNELTCLRSLNLSGCCLENIPSNINKLIHLRWLKLSKNYALKELPETIGELYNLQTLSVNWCDGLKHFPKGVERLTNLRHLKNDYTYFLLPKGIGKLSGLRQLLRITIDPKFKDACSLQDLKNLKSISGSLTVFFMERERYTLVEDAKQAQLEEKKHITALSLNFPERATEEWIPQEDEELVEALKPPRSLELLRITSCTGTNSPSWINTLTSLKKLKLWYWNNCEHLPALGMLPCLEYVEFNNFGRVKKVTAAFYRMDGGKEASSSTAAMFPKLNYLQFLNMTEWEEWNDYDGDEEVMPCLSYLSIENCPKLKALPNFIRRKASLLKGNLSGDLY